VKSVADSGQKVKISQFTTVVPVPSLHDINAAAQGMYASSQFQQPGTSPAGDKFSSAMTATDPKALQDDASEGTYTGVLIFAQVTKSLTDFSGLKVLDALNQAKNIDVGTIAPIPSFPADSGIPDGPRIFDTKLYSYVFEGNSFRLTSDTPVDTKFALS
jgi:ABC-type branched-subunit amino acid transport system substrate-binding protein